MTPKQITIIVLMGFIICIVGAFAIYRLLYPLNINPDDILYIVQPGLNYGNQLGMVFVVVCIVGFFLTFYIPVATNWNKERCNDGMMFLAPLFDKNANKTLRDCAQRIYDNPSAPTTTISFPAGIVEQTKLALQNIYNKIRSIQTLTSIKDRTLVNARLRGNLSTISDNRVKLNNIKSLKTEIKRQKQKVKSSIKQKEKTRKQLFKHDNLRKQQQSLIDNRVQKRQFISKSTHDKLKELIRKQTKSQIDNKLASQQLDSNNTRLKILSNDLAKQGNEKELKKNTKINVKNAKNQIK